MGESQIEHLCRRLNAEVADLSARVDRRLRELNDAQRAALLQCAELLDSAFPNCPVSQIEAVETIHLRCRLEFVKLMNLDLGDAADGPVH